MSETMVLEPLGERIIVRQIKTEKIGSIIVPDSSQKKSLEGIVLAVGPDADWVKAGDVVLFGRHAGFDLPSELDGYENCKLMNNEDILARIQREVPIHA